MSVTATYNQITSTATTWIGTFQIGGVYYAIKDPNRLYRIETDGTATYLRAISGNVWGDVNCDGTYIYRASSTTIFKINPADASVPYSSACANLRCLGIDTAGARIFGLTNAGALYVFTTNNMTQYYVNNVGAATYGGKMVYLNGALYIPVYGGKIKKYVVDTGVTTTLSNSLSAGWLCLDTDGQYIYGTVDGGRIYRIYPDDSSGYEEIQGDSAGRFWYSNTYYNGQIWANAYNGYCYKIALPIPDVPTSSVSTSTIYADTAVTLSCSTSGATIKYTTDGTTPSATNGTTYSAPFTVSKTTTIKFCAIKDGYLTAGVNVVLTWASLKTQIGTQNVNSALFAYGDYLYGAFNGAGTGIYRINPNTGAATLLIADGTYYIETRGYAIEYGRPIFVNGSVILIPMISNTSIAAVGEFDLNGNLLYIHELPMNYGSILNMFQVGSDVYAYSSNTNYPRVLHKVNLGGTTLTLMYSNLAQSLQYTSVISGTVNAITQTIDTNYPLGSRPCVTSLWTFNISTGAFTLVKTFDPIIVTSIGVCGVTYDGYRLFLAMYSDGIYVINFTDMSLRQMCGFAIPGTWNSVAMSNGWLYGIDSTSAYAYKFRTLLDLGTPYIYKSGTWKSENALYVRNNSTWKSATKAFKLKSGLWTRIF